MKQGLTSRGFTLIELGVVLAIIGIMAATAGADVVEIFKNKAAEQDAEQLYFVQQAAKGFYRATIVDPQTRMVDPMNARWPGEIDPATCDTGVLTQPGRTSTILVDLKRLQNNSPDSAFLPPTFTGKNLWSQPYTFDLVPTYVGRIPDPGGVFLCAFRITTDVPPEVQEVISTYLPLGTCKPETCGNDPPVAAGYVRCCSQIPKPGVEASMAQAKSYFDKVIEESGHQHGDSGHGHGHH